jgi:DNA-binding ferritin-like protein (Dps family)
MAARWIEWVTGSIEEKRRYRQYKARMKQLPPNYRTAVEAVNRYLMLAGGIAKGDVAIAMLEDLADLFEQSAANGTPVRAIVGDDPVEFVEEFVRNYAEGSWLAKERARLTEAINRAAGEDSADGGRKP